MGIEAFVALIKEVREKLIFSKRQEFFDALKNKAVERAGVQVAWPDALLFLEASDYRAVASEAGLEIK